MRQATLDIARRYDLTTWFGNPGSTEIPLLADLPADIRYILALHESAAVGMASGYAIASARPALVSLHSTAGLGNAVSAVATARTNRAPLVILVGQQDRRHLLAEPFLAGRLDGLAGDYPLAVFQPPRPQDLPSCLAQAWHAASLDRGPVIVIAPMGDWDEPADTVPLPAPAVSRRASGVDPADVTEIAALLDEATTPALITGAGADSAATWDALVALADRLDCPVFHEPFTARAGFPQDNPHFAGFLPAGRAALRATLAPYDALLVVGAALLKQYHYEPGPLLEPGTHAAVISEDPAEIKRSAADIALCAPLPAAVSALTAAVSGPSGTAPGTGHLLGPGHRPGPGMRQVDLLRRELTERAHGMTPEALFARLAPLITPDTIVVEESPSSREALQLMLPARQPLAYQSLAMGGLGYGMPAAIGMRLAQPDRPVLAVLGDGSSLYSIQALWTAVHYGVGVLFFVMANARYQVMDDLTSQHGTVPWSTLHGVSVATLADGFGMKSMCVTTPQQLKDVVAAALPELAHRTEPLLIEVRLGPRP